MTLVPAARPDGVAPKAGMPPAASAIAAALLGLVALVGALGRVPEWLLWRCALRRDSLMARLCMRQISGQTGDVLGATEQVGEITVLLVAAASLS